MSAETLNVACRQEETGEKVVLNFAVPIFRRRIKAESGFFLPNFYQIVFFIA